jgi:hypothetical protein
VLDGRHTWLEEGIADPSGDGPMLAERAAEVSRTVLSKEKGNDREYHELYVRSETGLGAEGAEPVRGQPRKAAEPTPEPVA